MPAKKAPQLSGSEQVAEFMKNIDHPLKSSMEAVREIVLNADDKITEHIKWKAPSFCFEGEDRVTLNIHRNEYILLVFHRGAKVKEVRGSRLMDDKTGLLEWVTDDRATVKLVDLGDVNEKKDKLKNVVKQWIAAAGE